MSERRRYPRLRLMVRVFQWAFSMLEEKRDNRRLSMTRCAVAAFTAVYCVRLLALPGDLGWPDAVLAFVVLFALPLGKALDRAPPATVVGAVTGMFGRQDPASRGVGMLWPTGSIGGRELDPPVSHGRPVEDEP